jgi:hypothetical protein
MPVDVEFRGQATFDVSLHRKPFLGDNRRGRKNAWRGRYA